MESFFRLVSAIAETVHETKVWSDRVIAESKLNLNGPAIYHALSPRDDAQRGLQGGPKKPAHLGIFTFISLQIV